MDALRCPHCDVVSPEAGYQAFDGMLDQMMADGAIDGDDAEAMKDWLLCSACWQLCDPLDLEQVEDYEYPDFSA
jgi:hypothetical protein